MLSFRNFFQGKGLGRGLAPSPDDRNKVKYQGNAF